MKRVLSILLALSIIVSVISFADFSACALASSGKCGENVTWSFDSSTGTLTISGSGPMWDFGDNYDVSPFRSARNIKKIVIKSGVTTIGDCVFYNCSGLTSITIPNSVTSIGTDPFSYCTGLTSITIPGRVKSIGDSAFYFCTGLTSITIPGSVKSIGEYAFYDCSGLTSVSISSGVKSIGEDAFCGCEILNSITIPASVTSITEGAFLGCDDLKYVFYSGSASEWKKIKIGKYNYCLTDAIIHYNSSGDHNYKWQKYTKATLKENGKHEFQCSVCGHVTETIYRPKTFKFIKKAYTYDGNVKKPTLIVLDSKGRTIAPSNYKVTYSKGRKAVGKYNITVKFKGNYKGTKKLTFTIKPAKAEITKAEPMNKAFGIKWKKVSKISGYEVQVSTSKKFKKNVKSYTAKASSESAKVSKNIKGNTTYYIRIRTFKTVKYNGKKIKIYSKWSKVKSVTTKG